MRMEELSLHILDALVNGVEAGASRMTVFVEEDTRTDRLRIEITDNGRGMTQDMVAKVLDPFYTTRKTRHVGLGIPLFEAAARQCEGALTIRSEAGKGTELIATFRLSHVDRAPLGDIASTILAVLLSERQVDIEYVHRVDGRTFEFDSAEIRKELGTIPFSHPRVRNFILSFIREGEAKLRQGSLEEKITGAIEGEVEGKEQSEWRG